MKAQIVAPRRASRRRNKPTNYKPTNSNPAASLGPWPAAAILPAKDQSAARSDTLLNLSDEPISLTRRRRGGRGRRRRQRLRRRAQDPRSDWPSARRRTCCHYAPPRRCSRFSSSPVQQDTFITNVPYDFKRNASNVVVSSRPTRVAVVAGRAGRQDDPVHARVPARGAPPIRFFFDLLEVLGPGRGWEG
jgi:hypothetical protein